MTLPEIIYCQQCHLEHRQTPASWAHPDPANAKRADFYCFPCLTREGIAVAACQPISTWRTAADNLPPGVSPKARNVKFPAKPKRERPGRLDSERNSIVPNRAARPKVDHRHDGNGHNGHSHIAAGSYKARMMSLAEYQRTAKPRDMGEDLQPLIAHVKAMAPGTVALWECKQGDNPERVTHTNADLPVSLWQKLASPVWMDINPSDTLQRESAREQEDERHICPLQLEVIRRALLLWSNPGDLVLSPFAGIGSEGYTAIQQGRRFVGVELKGSYFRQAAANLKTAHSANMPLFTNSDESDEAIREADAR